MLPPERISVMTRYKLQGFRVRVGTNAKELSARHTLDTERTADLGADGSEQQSSSQFAQFGVDSTGF